MSQCRLCARVMPDYELIQILIVAENGECLKDKIQQCLQLVVTEQDRLPRYSCVECARQVSLFYDFHQQVRFAQEVLEGTSQSADDACRSKNNSPEIEEITVKNEYSSDDDNLPLSNHIKVQKLELSNIKTTTEVTGKSLQCRTCRRMFKNEQKLTKHKCRPRQYACHLCQKTCTSSSNLKQHLNTHNAHLVKPYSCNECGKAYAHASNLTVHRRIHSGSKPYKCDRCGKLFTRSDHLKRHRQRVCSNKNGEVKRGKKSAFAKYINTDTGKSMFLCPTCNRPFTSSSNLRSHMRVHSGERPYVCQVCAKSFKDSDNLVKHLRVHSGERPYMCAVCGRSFTDGSNLNQHRRIHSGERPHQCTLCARAFNRRSDLRKHQRTHQAPLTTIT